MISIQVMMGPCFRGIFSIHLREQGVEFFQPYDGGDSPKEAVQEVDAAAEVEGNVAVVPENFSEDDFGENAAEVFVGAAEEGSEGE